MDFAGSIHCHCPATASGPACQKKMFCATKPCMYGGTCVDKKTAFQCICKSPRRGLRCELLRNPCEPNPCKNRGGCVPLRSGRSYFCVCERHFHRANCHLMGDVCVDTPCLNDGRCFLSSKSHYGCNCLSGFAGSRCQLPYDACKPVPCQHGGTCFDTGNTAFKCLCPEEYTGATCQIMVGSCEKYACANKGVCEPSKKLHKFVCRCPEGFDGVRCENRNGCHSKQCLNGATCEPIYVPNLNEAKRLDYKCHCTYGYGGKNCELMRSPTGMTNKLTAADHGACEALKPCFNNGVCQVTIIVMFVYL